MSDLLINIFEDVPGVRAFTTTREAGNMRDMARIADLLEQLGLGGREIVFPIQTHTNNVDIIKQVPAERSRDVDGSISALDNVALCSCHADCTPLFFYDPVKRVIAMIHSGWKGTATRIGEVTSLKMQREFGCNPEDILVHVGVSISKCCFEIEEDVFSQFDEPEYTMRTLSDGTVKYNVDLKEYNKRMLMKTGIPADNISISEHCSCCETDTFFSYRAEHTDSRMISIITLV